MKLRQHVTHVFSPVWYPHAGERLVWDVVKYAAHVELAALHGVRVAREMTGREVQVKERERERERDASQGGVAFLASSGLGRVNPSAAAHKGHEKGDRQQAWGTEGLPRSCLRLASAERQGGATCIARNEPVFKRREEAGAGRGRGVKKLPFGGSLDSFARNLRAIVGHASSRATLPTCD